MKKQELNLTEEENDKDIYNLRLFITGASPNSAKAVTNLKSICEKYIQNRYTLEIIDVYQETNLVLTEQVIALPMLIKSFPLPVKRLIGDMSDLNKVLKGIGIDNL